MENLPKTSNGKINRNALRAFDNNVARDKSIHQVLEEQVERTPESVAVIFEDAQLSYRELNQRTNQLAHHLQKLGVKSETLVGVCLERSLEMVVGILGILKAGGAYVPIDPAYPQERLAFMLEDARPPVLLTQARLLTELPEHQARLVMLDRDWPSISGQSEEDLSGIATAENLAYVIYTSGSTGKPKGVMITHANLGHYVQAMRKPLGIVAQDTCLHTASFSFSSSVRQLMVPLSQGSSVVIATSEQIGDPLALFELIKQRGVTIIDLVPSYWRSCLQALVNLRPLARKELLDNKLRLILSASEPLSSDIPRDWTFVLEHGARFINLFGQTETAGIVATYPIPRTYEDVKRVVPIGRPIPDTQIHVLDSNLQPVPDGVAGEVHIGGPGIGRGYLSNKELTAAKFVPDPFSDTPGARLYKTGDLGRIGSDRNLEFLGRMDNQVKIRGHRVEPGEIEALLRQYPRVHDALVVARKEDANNPRLVAYVVPERANSPSLSGHDRYELPNNMAIVQQNKHETDFFYQEIFIDQTYLRHGITLRDGDTVFDVGANIGMFALFAQQVRQNVSIFAFEPIPATFETLAINASLYCDNTKLFQCGLAEKAGDAEFTFYPNSSGQSSRYADIDQEREDLRVLIANTLGTQGKSAYGYLDRVVEQRVQGTKVTCHLKTLSEIIREHNVERIDLLKIDVQKSELDVLTGIEECDWARIEQIVVETHDLDDNLARVTTLLRSHGYAVVAEQEELLKGSNLYNLFAVRRASHSNSNDESDANDTSVIPVLQKTIVTVGELQRHVQEKLPDYLWPSAYVVMESLPRLPNGKIDHRALPVPNQARPELAERYVGTRTPVEEKLAVIWAQVLGIEEVDIHDKFFELGGDSLKVIQVISRVGAVFHVKLPLRTLFDSPTVAEVASAIEELLLEELEESAIAPVPR